jgi:hypothetical protein
VKQSSTWCGDRGADVSEEVDLLVVVQELAIVLAERKRAARAGRRAIERRQNLLPEFVLDNLFSRTSYNQVRAQQVSVRAVRLINCCSVRTTTAGCCTRANSQSADV